MIEKRAYRPNIFGQVKNAYKNIIKKERRILFIGDLHEPFCLDGYLQHCIDTYKNYNCNQVVFAGDVIDNHYSSYHEPDPDGMGAGSELDYAIKRLKKWHEAFPLADVCIGNHDRIVARKAFSAGLSNRWLKDYKMS